MLFAIAVLLIHPQLASTNSLPAKALAIDTPVTISASAITVDTESAMPTEAGSYAATAQPAAELTETLPDAPVPMPLETPAPAAFLNAAKPMTVSVDQLRAENRRNELIWKGLIVGSSGAATFDAWSTRHAITTHGATELNPLLKPFAGNGSLYAAVQVAPVLLDFAGKKMMYNRHSWVRRAWWIPQSASFVASILCGAHNLSYR